METYDGSSGYDTELRTDGVSMLYPFVLMNGDKEYIGTCGIKFKTSDECIAAGEKWMSLNRETQILMWSKPDYTKFV